MFFQFHLLNVVICLFCVLMPTSESQYDVTNLTTETYEEIEKVTHHLLLNTNYSEANCGETQKMVDECFKNLPSHLMEFLQTAKIVGNKEEIASKCKVFKRGMECFDRYTARCLPEAKVVHFQNNVAGARGFVSKFCDDRKFQSGYLRHKECFYHIQGDWKRCTEDFQNILSDELNGHQSNNITHKYMQFCCARHAYETCIYNSARFKCYKNSTKFTTDIVRMLSEEKLFSNCRRYESLLCAAPKSSATQNLVFILMCWIIAVNGRNNSV